MEACLILLYHHPERHNNLSYTSELIGVTESYLLFAFNNIQYKINTFTQMDICWSTQYGTHHKNIQLIALQM